MDEPRAGHRLVPHTADVIVEAWGPTRATCLAEAVAALGEVLAEEVTAVARRLDLDVAGAEEDLLALVLEEAIYVLDTEDLVVVGADLVDTPAGVAGELGVVPLSAVAVTGAAPKAVAATELERDGDLWRARAIVDV